MSHPLSGLRPELNVGIRPDHQTALNTVATLKCGAILTMAPSAPKRPNWSTGVKRAHRLLGLVSDPNIDVVESREDDITHAIEQGLPVDGFVGFVRLAGGSIKAIPHRGQPFIGANARVLARVIDRGLNGPQHDPLTLLGLNAPPKPAPMSRPARKRAKWVKLGLADLASLRA